MAFGDEIAPNNDPTRLPNDATLESVFIVLASQKTISLLLMGNLTMDIKLIRTQRFV